jgi:guanine nucleotide-binding protein G(I)/G(S)/G(T) subunit beta-1
MAAPGGGEAALTAEEVQARMLGARREAETLKARIEAVKVERNNGGLGSVRAVPTPLPPKLVMRKGLKGHFGKVYAADWAGAGELEHNLVSARCVTVADVSAAGVREGHEGLAGRSAQPGRTPDGLERADGHQAAVCVQSGRGGERRAAGGVGGGSRRAGIKLTSVWVMSAAYEKTESTLAACGGLDNLCTIYAVRGRGGGGGMVGGGGGGGGGAGGGGGGGAAVAAGLGVGVGLTDAEVVPPLVSLSHHDGYVSSCRFRGPTEMITASGDSTCVLWDVTVPEPKQIFADHASDALCLALSPTSRDVFVSGSCDQTAKVWDTRLSRACVQTFVGHDSDINAVCFMRNGLCFCTASEDATCKLFDLRSYARLNEFACPSFTMSVTSADFSASGRLLFAGYDDFRAYAWETLTENPEAPVQMLEYHQNKVSCLGINAAGQALVTGSWDTELSVWA